MESMDMFTLKVSTRGVAQGGVIVLDIVSLSKATSSSSAMQETYTFIVETQEGGERSHRVISRIG